MQPRSQPLGPNSNNRWYGYGVFGNEGPNGANIEDGFGVFKRWYHGGDIASHAAYWAHWPEMSDGPFSAAIICNNMGPNQNSLNRLEPAIGWLLLNALRATDDRPRLKLVIGS